MSGSTQSFGHHAKMVPMYHYVGFSLVLTPTVYFGYQAVTNFAMAPAMLMVLGLGAMVMAFFGRVFPLGVQDRVIRLEEHLRMERILAPELKARIGEITTDQLIGLRFAPDAELPGLMQKVLDGSLTDRKAIKQAIQNWRADEERI
ncbi:MAG: DUF6526 family protein [Gemmatimonadetes bacterium]|nr:DUF6526 family protein [Gemmatimonadota bacterium]MDA1102428.1 DUF6526 family protein [Gemmatimonadota bacterium]